VSEPGGATTAVTFRDLGHAYHGDQWVFRHYSATVERGKVFALLGPNGRGKTTLLHLLLGALHAREGTLAVNGRMAFVPQLFEVSFDYTVLDMVLMGRARRVGLFSQPSAADASAATAALDRFGIAGLADRPFSELSGGERQLVVFARAIVADAEILILDEPTSALDLKNQILILDWIARLSRDHGLTVLLTTHHPHHALAVADDVLLMLGQTEFVCGPAGDVLTEKNLRALYGVDLKRITFEHGGRNIQTLVPVIAPNQGESKHIS
jgi:iron complex transport system ATP-binding protein